MIAEPTDRWRKVRIWLGELLIAEYIAEADEAARYQRAMTPRFAGLRIDLESLQVPPGERSGVGRLKRLPGEQLWPLTVR